MKAPSGPIKVFGDDTFVVEFTDGDPVKFILTVFEHAGRRGTYDLATGEAIFADGAIAENAEYRVLRRAYVSWMHASG